MDYQLKRMDHFKSLGRYEEYMDVLMMVAASVVLDQPIREEDREFLRSYLQIKQDIPKEDILEGNVGEIPIEEVIIDESADIDYESMTKRELDDYALEHFNIHLDRRRSKRNMINDLMEAINGTNSTDG